MRKLTAATVIAVAACASPGAPPGGPVDIDAPRLIAVAPESGQVNVTPRAVVFRFDEVVTERPAGVPSLTAQFLVSPQEGAPVVDWRRSEITVRPRRGWLRNTVYTVVMLPGMADLRGNISNVGATTVFSTGAEIPRTSIAGVAFDWVAATPARGALVQAITPDSVVYVTVADTTGRFTLPHLPPGGYLVQAIMDDNRNRALDPREKFDTLTVTLTDTVTVELLAHMRDSLPPRISDVREQDSLTLRVQFDLPLDPAQTFSTTQFRVVGPDSVAVPLRGASPVLPDTAVAPTPTAPDAVPGTRLRPSRPVPPRAVLLELPSPLLRGANYRVWAEDIRGLTGLSSTSQRELRTAAEPTPEAEPPTESESPPGSP